MSAASALRRRLHRMFPLAEQQVLEIRAALQEYARVQRHCSPNALAKKYDRTADCIRKIGNGKRRAG